jgi:hypothetical protein
MGRKEEGTKKQEVRNYEWGKGKERGRNGKAGGWIGFHPIEKIPKRDFLHAALVGAGSLKPKNSRGGRKLKRMRGCGHILWSCGTGELGALVVAAALTLNVTSGGLIANLLGLFISTAVALITNNEWKI